MNALLITWPLSLGLAVALLIEAMVWLCAANSMHIWLFLGTTTGMVLAAQLIRRATKIGYSLRQSEEQYRQSFENSPIGMSLVALDGRRLRVNVAVSEITGYSEKELLDDSLPDITHPDDVSEERHSAGTLIAGRAQRFQMRKRYFHKQGYIVWVRLTTTIIRDPAGKARHFVSQIEDITSQILAEEDLRTKINELKNLQKLLIGKNLALEVESQRAQEANRLKSEFLANMSHELRTPLNAIIGFGQLIQDSKLGPVTEEQAMAIRDVLASARHLLELINSLLDLAKIEAGRMDIFPREFDAAEAIRSVLAVIHPIALEKSLSLTHRIQLQDAIVFLDHQKFNQILFNLLSNAIKFTPEGGSIELLASPSDANTFSVAIKDTGIGIKPEEFPLLFAEFRQLDSGPSRSYQGTGLGLVLTRKLARLQGGEIRVESAPGEGSTFTAILPRQALQRKFQ